MKKYMVLMMVVFIAISAVAHAAVPSKTTQDMTKVTSVVSASGVPLGDDFAVELVQEAPAATQELAKVAAVVSEGASPATYFADKEADIALLVPEDFDINVLELNEFSPLTAINYDASYGDVVVSFEFVTEYIDGQVVVAMLGIVVGENDDGTALVEWYALRADVVDCLLQVHFTQDILALLNGAEAMIAILSEPIA